MKFLDIKLKFKDSAILDIRNVINVFGRLDRRRLYEWQTKGYIQRIANNYYIFNDADINDVILKVIANKIYSPSYIGLESALSYYGLIPETVFQINSITTRKTKMLKSKIAQFSYHSTHRWLFWGYNLENHSTNSFFISDIEKTILDYLYLNPHVNDEAAFEELRLNKELLLNTVNLANLKQYLKIFSNNQLSESLAKLMRFLNVKF